MSLVDLNCMPSPDLWFSYGFPMVLYGYPMSFECFCLIFCLPSPEFKFSYGFLWFCNVFGWFQSFALAGSSVFLWFCIVLQYLWSSALAGFSVFLWISYGKNVRGHQSPSSPVPVLTPLSPPPSRTVDLHSPCPLDPPPPARTVTCTRKFKRRVLAFSLLIFASFFVMFFLLFFHVLWCISTSILAPCCRYFPCLLHYFFFHVLLDEP